MERFTGQGSQSIRDQAEKSIKNYKREIDEIKSKLKMLREASES
jgi:transcription initiation factor TFIIIB Brf1 subunit/transcription initiation factor TFIIB